MNFEEAVSNFYKKKKRYDSKLKEQKKNIRENDDLSLEEKREAYSKIKLKCIKCKRDVGTIFSTDNRELTAKCGDKSNPCSLNIQIKMGQYDYIPTLLRDIHYDLELAKLNINKIKLDLLFGLTDENQMEDAFVKMKETYKSLINSKNIVESKLNEYNLMNIEEVGEIRIIERKKVALSQQLILNNLVQNFRDLIKDYQQDNGGDTKRAKMIDAIDLYNNQIIPATKIINSALYDINTVIFEKGKYNLVQIPRKLESQVLELEAPEIVSNIK